MLQSETTVSSDPFYRPGLWAGLGFVFVQLASIVIFVATLLPSLPPIDGPAERYAELYVAKADETMLLLYLTVLSLVVLIPFLASLASAIRAATASVTLAAIAALAGLAMMVIPVANNIVEAYFGTMMARLGGDPVSIQSIDGLLPLANSVGGLLRALLLAVIVLASWRGTLAPRWIGWIALLLAVLSVVGSFTVLVPAFFPIVAVSTLLFLVFLVILIVAMLRRSVNA